jgi:hypothetical protein
VVCGEPVLNSTPALNISASIKYYVPVIPPKAATMAVSSFVKTL